MNIAGKASCQKTNYMLLNPRRKRYIWVNLIIARCWRCAKGRLRVGHQTKKIFSSAMHHNAKKEGHHSMFVVYFNTISSQMCWNLTKTFLIKN